MTPALSKLEIKYGSKSRLVRSPPLSAAEEEPQGRNTRILRKSRSRWPWPECPSHNTVFFFFTRQAYFFFSGQKKKFPLFSRLFGIFMSPSGRGTPVMELHPSSGFFCPARVWPVATIKTDSVEFCFFSPRCPPSIEKRRSKPQVTSPSRAWSSLPCPSGRSTLLALSV